MKKFVTDRKAMLVALSSLSLTMSFAFADEGSEVTGRIEPTKMVAAQGNNMDRLTDLESQVKMLKQQNVQGTAGARHPGYLNGPGFYVTTSFIYWRPDQDGLDSAYRTRTVGPPAALTIEDADIDGFGFDYEPGFQLGAGYTFEYDDWDAYLNWTRLYADSHMHKHSIDTTTDRLVSLWFPPLYNGSAVPNAAEEIRSNWRLHYNVLDAELGRRYFTSKALSLRPLFGIRGAWIDQSFRHQAEGFEYDAFVPTKLEAHNNYHGVGLRTGVEMGFHFNKNWGLYGHVSGSLLYGKFEVKESIHGINPLNGVDEGLFHNKDDFRRVRTNWEIGGGFMWEHFFHNDKYHVQLSAGWDFVQWFRQNQLRQFIGFGGTLQNDLFSIFQGGDLAMQGLTLSGRLDF